MFRVLSRARTVRTRAFQRTNSFMMISAMSKARRLLCTTDVPRPQRESYSTKSLMRTLPVAQEVKKILVAKRTFLARRLSRVCTILALTVTMRQMTVDSKR